MFKNFPTLGHDLKLMVKKSRVSNILDQSTRNTLKTLTNEDKSIVNSRLDESIDEYPDEVFDNLIDFDENMSVEDNDDPVDIPSPAEIRPE